MHVDGDAVVLRHGTSSLTAYAIGAPWARELAATLDDRAETEIGARPDHRRHRARARRTEAPLARLEQSIHELLPQPAPGTWLVILDRPRGGLVLELSPKTDPFIRDRWLHGLRAAAPHEVAAAEPPHLTIVRAPRAGTVAELVTACTDPGSRARPRSPRPRARRRRSDQVYRPVGNTTRWIAPCSGHTSSTPSAPNAT